MAVIREAAKRLSGTHCEAPPVCAEGRTMLRSTQTSSFDKFRRAVLHDVTTNGFRLSLRSAGMTRRVR